MSNLLGDIDRGENQNVVMKFNEEGFLVLARGMKKKVCLTHKKKVH